ncbi:MAG: hypothetical protein GF405_05530 [Candidatus Eisenbacteria bacterium]|nr:hypothetical protein [Candidatus Eisenbacteria bacterium]
MSHALKRLIKRRSAVLLLVIVVLTIGVRVGFVMTLDDELYWPDPRYFDTIAWRIVSEGRIATGEPDEMAVLRPPFQAFVMSVPYALAGHSYRAAYLFQALLSGFIPLLLYLIARDSLGKGVGLLAAFFGAFYPYYVYMAGALYPTQTATLLMLAFVYFAMKTRKRPKVSFAFAQGVALGALVLTRPVSLIFAPFAFLWTLRWKRNILAAVVLALAAMAVVLPWTVRNSIVSGEFIPVSAVGGHAFMLGNHPDATATSQTRTPVPEDLAEARKTTPPGAWDQMCMDRGLEYVRDDPGRFVSLYLQKLVNYYRFYPDTIEKNEFTGSRTTWIALLTSGPAIILGLAGMWLARRKWRELLPAYAVVILYSLLYPAFTTCVRYRLPLDAYLLLFAAAALAYIGRRMARDRHRSQTPDPPAAA